MTKKQPEVKHQMTSTKHQINSNDQNSKFQAKLFGSFGIEILDLFGIWNLGFGISDSDPN
jgi:hypothetical protein